MTKYSCLRHGDELATGSIVVSADTQNGLTLFTVVTKSGNLYTKVKKSENPIRVVFCESMTPEQCRQINSAICDARGASMSHSTKVAYVAERLAAVGLEEYVAKAIERL